MNRCQVDLKDFYGTAVEQKNKS